MESNKFSGCSGENLSILLEILTFSWFDNEIGPACVLHRIFGVVHRSHRKFTIFIRSYGGILANFQILSFLCDQILPVKIDFHGQYLMIQYWRKKGTQWSGKAFNRQTWNSTNATNGFPSESPQLCVFCYWKFDPDITCEPLL